MKLAKDLMTPHPHTVQSGAELAEVVRWFFDNGHASAPVVTPTGEVLGLMTEISLLRAYVRLHLQPSRNEKVAHHKELLSKAVFVDEDAPLADVLKTLVSSPISRVLVINKQKVLVGIISPRDILAYLVGQQRQTFNLHDELDKAKKQVEELSHQLSDVKSILKTYEGVYFDNPTMMHSVDADGVIIMANRKAHLVLGYDDEELIGKSIYDIYAKSYHHEAIQGLATIMDKGLHHVTYSTMVTKQGKKIRVELSSSALRDSRGNFVGTITVSRQVDSETLLRALHGALNQDGIGESQLAELIKKLDHERVD